MSGAVFPGMLKNIPSAYRALPVSQMLTVRHTEAESLATRTAGAIEMSGFQSHMAVTQ